MHKNQFIEWKHSISVYLQFACSPLACFALVGTSKALGPRRRTSPWKNTRRQLPRSRTFSDGSDRLVGLVVKVSASRAEDPGFKSHLRRDFSRWSHTRDLKIGTPVATLPGAWQYRGQRWDWLARCQYTLTGWGRKFDPQLLSQCGST